MKEGDILKIDISIQPTETLHELVKQLRELRESQPGVADDELNSAIEKIESELFDREDLGPDGGSGHPWTWRD